MGRDRCQEPPRGGAEPCWPQTEGIWGPGATIPAATARHHHNSHCESGDRGWEEPAYSSSQSDGFGTRMFARQFSQRYTETCIPSGTTCARRRRGQARLESASRRMPAELPRRAGGRVRRPETRRDIEEAQKQRDGIMAGMFRKWGWVLLAWVAMADGTTAVIGQTPSSDGAEHGPTGTAANVGAGRLGGAALADFDTLINLIQQTIEPDSWLVNGGTSSILPYPSGVYVDPSGYLRRTRSAATSVASLRPDAAAPRHPWRVPSGMRIVSLKALDRALYQVLHDGLRPDAELLQLAGLSKIDLVRIDSADEDILIAGPARGDGTAIQLQDVAVVAALVRQDTAPLGCSIEPTHAGLIAAKQFIESSDTSRLLARNPRAFVERMQQRIGPHQVHVFGMDSKSGTALALIDADEHMKQVGFGAVRTHPYVHNYFEHLETSGKVPAQSMIRWWFAYNDAEILANADQGLFRLPAQCVRVMSEQQWVTAQGRAPTGQHDAAADAFASEMTERLEDLRKTYPNYARLCSVFEIALALQLGVESTGQPSLSAWFPTLCALGSTTSDATPEPRGVEGLTTWHRMSNGTVVAVVSGGVQVEPAPMAAAERWRPSKLLSGSLIPPAPEIRPTSHGAWWWDEAE